MYSFSEDHQAVRLTEVGNAEDGFERINIGVRLTAYLAAKLIHQFRIGRQENDLCFLNAEGQTVRSSQEALKDLMLPIIYRHVDSNVGRLSRSKIIGGAQVDLPEACRMTADMIMNQIWLRFFPGA